MVDADVEKRLWSAADQLWANTGLKPAQFSAPVLGLTFRRRAESKFEAAEEVLGPVWSVGRRKVSNAGFRADGVIFLLPEPHCSRLQSLPGGDDIGKAINDIMRASRTAIE